MSSAMMMDRGMMMGAAGMSSGMPSMGQTSGMPGMMPNLGMAMVPRCTMKMEK